MSRFRVSPGKMMLSVLISVLALLPLSECQFCEPLYDNTWDAFMEAIDFSFGFAILCPFHITGDGCPTNNDGYHVESQDLYIMCESSFFGGGDASSCVIDCPSTHFTVFPQASLTLDGVTLKGSKSSAIRVKPSGSLTMYSSDLNGNSNESGNGGAIDAEQNTHLTVLHSAFNDNHALNGGAVYHRGVALVKGSEFVGNIATNGGGGAIFSGSQSETGLIEDLFQGNRASFFGPAVFDGSGAISVREGNTACGNMLGEPTIGGTYVICDGIYVASGGSGLCNPFAVECVVPTSPPTVSPTHPPTAEPTETSTASPTKMPTIGPTNQPTQAPTSHPSKLPTGSPTASMDNPSDNPMRSPTKEPTLSPTLHPTTEMSSTVTTTQSPSLRPTVKPTSSPSSSPSLRGT